MKMVKEKVWYQVIVLNIKIPPKMTSIHSETSETGIKLYAMLSYATTFKITYLKPLFFFLIQKTLFFHIENTLFCLSMLWA